MSSALTRKRALTLPRLCGLADAFKVHHEQLFAGELPANEFLLVLAMPP